MVGSLLRTALVVPCSAPCSTGEGWARACLMTALTSHGSPLVCPSLSSLICVIALQPCKRGRLHVYDGSCSRPGGPKLANDARGTGMVANMMLLPSGTFCVRRFKEVSRLRAGASPQERRKAELCWSYGDAYWAHPPHAKKLRTAR